jgi:hypothetical protein
VELEVSFMILLRKDFNYKMTKLILDVGIGKEITKGLAKLNARIILGPFQFWTSFSNLMSSL